MKTKLLAITLTILILLAFTTNYTYASEKKAYVAKENEELYGTWVNEEYNSSSKSAIHVFKADGTWVIYRKTSDEIPHEEGTYTIIDKWTESNDDVCYKIKWETDYTAKSGYELNCISNSGSSKESATSSSDYPTQFDPSKCSCISWYPLQETEMICYFYTSNKAIIFKR